MTPALKLALEEQDRIIARLRENVDRLVACVKLSTEYRQGNPAFEYAVARASDSAPEGRK